MNVLQGIIPSMSHNSFHIFLANFALLGDMAVLVSSDIGYWTWTWDTTVTSNNDLKEKIMPLYISLVRWTQQGVANVRDSQNRLDSGRKAFREIESRSSRCT